MLRKSVVWGLGFVLGGLAACSKGESARSTGGTDLGCSDPSCGADASIGRPDASMPVQDASTPTMNSDGATPPSNGDVFVPPFDRDTGIDNGDASSSLFDVQSPFDGMLPPRPDSGVVVPPLPDTTVCANSGTLAFRTDFLEGADADAGTTPVPPASPAFRAAWHNALVATGRPGPALIVLSNFGTLAPGGTRRFRFGTADGRMLGDSALNAVFSFERPSTNAQNPFNPFDGTYSVQSTTRVQGSLFSATGATSVLLRFVKADRSRYDVPVVGVSLDAILRSDLNGNCSALDVVDLALGIPASALGLTLDGQPLSSLLGAPVSPDGGPSIAVVHLTGPAAVVPFEEAP
jgi:hypothetical protein